VRFAFNVGIEGLNADATRITGVATSTGVLQADAYVLALGSWSPRLVRPLGISLPVYPVKGYSITVPITDAEAAPVSTVMGRELQGRDHAARQSDPGRRHRGNLRLFHQALSGTPRDARPFPDRSVSARRRPRQGDVLERVASDDARWSADHRRDALPESPPQHRTRHARLDHGLRLGEGARRSHVRPQAGG